MERTREEIEKESQKYIEQLLQTDDEILRSLHKIVLDTLEEEKNLSELIYKESVHKEIPLADKISDKVSDFVGSWTFIIFCIVSLFTWIYINKNHISFDPYPFILLNLILSMVAALQAPIIMMSQNRKEDKDRKRSEGDYLINLKAELEIRELNQKIDLLIANQMKILIDLQKEQMQHFRDISDKLDETKTYFDGQ